MKLCIPYAQKHLAFFKCAAKDFGIDFVSPPPAGKYTAEIGEAFKLCDMNENQILALGSCAECYYLGADSAVIFNENDDCPERTAALIRNALINNKMKMDIRAVESKDLFAFFKEQGNLKLTDYFETKRNFNQALKLSSRYCEERSYVLANNNPKSNILVDIYDRNIALAKDLLSLKLLYKLYLKRLETLNADYVCIPAATAKNKKIKKV